MPSKATIDSETRSKIYKLLLENPDGLTADQLRIRSGLTSNKVAACILSLSTTSLLSEEEMPNHRSRYFLVNYDKEK